MSWQQLIIITTDKYSESLSDLLTKAGSFAISLEDNADEPLFEPLPGSMPLWKNIRLSALFAAEVALNPIILLIQQILPADAIHSHHIQALPEQNWQQQLRAQFQPLQIGKKLWICPSWHQLPEPNAINVILNPGLAFGTGTHPTTKLCLEWLEQNIKGNETVIDYGCGSGILAIAALKLGAKQVYAIDHDPQALTATRNNAELNQLSDQQLLTYLPQQLPSVKADIIVANIFANVLTQLATTFVPWLTTGGKVVLSGILEEQLAAIKKSYEKYFAMLDNFIYNSWIITVFEKK